MKPGKYLDRLINLDKELGGGILIHKVENDSVTTEDLIMQVSNGTIDYAVCDNDLAKLNKTYYPNLNISMPISFDQRASWAVRKTSPAGSSSHPMASGKHDFPILPGKQQTVF